MTVSGWQLIAVVLAASAHLAPGKVVDLSDSNFDSELENRDTALVMFYAPWCGHCKKMKPEFEKSADELLENDPPVHLFKVDCTEAGEETCKRFEITGYPTLYIFRNGEKSTEYYGPKEYPGIMKYMKAKVGPASKSLANDAELKALIDSTTVDGVIVANLADGSDEMKMFMDVADSLRETRRFAHMAPDASSSLEQGLHLYRPKLLRTKLEEDVLKFAGTATDMQKITQWITKNYHGKVGHRTTDNVNDFARDGNLVVAYYDVDYERNPKGTNYWRNRVMKAAFKHDSKDKEFAVSSSKDFGREMDTYGMSASSANDKPVVAIRGKDGKKYVMEAEFSVDALISFLEAFDSGKVEAYIKSEPVPESNDAPVKVAVGRNFDEVVTNSDKDVLVEFYAPWCGHCKSLAPIYDELGAKMTGENVEIVKMDATANDPPARFGVQGFPTIYWVKKGEKPVQYKGGRTLDELVKYIAKAATEELNGYDRKGKAKKTEL